MGAENAPVPCWAAWDTGPGTAAVQRLWQSLKAGAWWTMPLQRHSLICQSSGNYCELMSRTPQHGSQHQSLFCTLAGPSFPSGLQLAEIQASRLAASFLYINQPASKQRNSHCPTWSSKQRIALSSGSPTAAC